MDQRGRRGKENRQVENQVTEVHYTPTNVYIKLGEDDYLHLRLESFEEIVARIPIYLN